MVIQNKTFEARVIRVQDMVGQPGPPGRLSPSATAQERQGTHRHEYPDPLQQQEGRGAGEVLGRGPGLFVRLVTDGRGEHDRGNDDEHKRAGRADPPQAAGRGACRRGDPAAGHGRGPRPDRSRKAATAPDRKVASARARSRVAPGTLQRGTDDLAPQQSHEQGRRQPVIGEEPRPAPTRPSSRRSRAEGRRAARPAAPPIAVRSAVGSRLRAPAAPGPTPRRTGNRRMIRLRASHRSHRVLGPVGCGGTGCWRWPCNKVASGDPTGVPSPPEHRVATVHGELDAADSVDLAVSTQEPDDLGQDVTLVPTVIVGEGHDVGGRQFEPGVATQRQAPRRCGGDHVEGPLVGFQITGTGAVGRLVDEDQFEPKGRSAT